MSMHYSDITGSSLGDFDTGPLSWVLGEIREALQRSRAALEEAALKSDDAGATLLNHANAYLNQAHGALQIVDVHGVGLVTEAAEEVLHAMMEGRLPVSAEHAALIGTIYQALIEYLEDLLAGSPQLPVLLFPYYQDLKQVLNAPRIHPADFLFPNFTNRLQSLSAAVDEAALGASGSIDYGALRPRFEKALLEVLKSPGIPANMPEIRDLKKIVAEIESAQNNGKARDFWRVMHGFADMAYAGKFTSDLYIKLVFARINLQIRQLAAHSDFMSERLLKEALFMIACGDEPTPLMQEIRTLYQIDGQIPADFEKRRYGLIDPEKLESARQYVAQAKTLWVQANTGNFQAAEAFLAKLDELAQASSSLYLPPLARLFETIGAILMEGEATASSDALSMEIASGLLFAENTLEQIRLLPADFGHKAEMLESRLKAIQDGQAPGDSDAMAMMPEMQQRYVMQLAAEMGASLRQVERLLDEYFADLSQSAMLAEARPILQQIEGGLALVEREDARQAVAQTIDTIDRLRDAAEPIGDKTLQTIAHNLSALGFFLEMLAQHPDTVKGRFSFDVKTGIFHARVVEAGDVRGTSFLYAEDDVEAARNELEAVLGKEEVRVRDKAAPLVPDVSAVAGEEEFDEDDLLHIFISEAEEALDYISSTPRSISTEAP